MTSSLTKGTAYDLVLGSHSVHTTPAALRDAQAHLAAIRARLLQAGRL